MLVKQIYDVIKLFETVRGVQLSETENSNNNKVDPHYYTRDEKECTLLLLVGQLMLEMSRLPLTVREDNMKLVVIRLGRYGFNAYTQRIIILLLNSIDHIPYMIEGDYLTQLHHSAKQLRFTHHHYQEPDQLTQNCETINYFRTVIKEYMILNAVLFNPKEFITVDNVGLLFDVMYYINNYANADHVFYEGVPLKGFEHITPVVQRRNEFLEFRFISDIMVDHILKMNTSFTPTKHELDNLDILQMLEIIDVAGDVNVNVGFTGQLPDQELVTRSFLIADETPLYMALETVARFMDWNPKLMDTPEWDARFDLIKTALLTRINHE